MPRITPTTAFIPHAPPTGGQHTRPSGSQANARHTAPEREPASPTAAEWEQLPQEIRERIACRMTARGLATFSLTSKANLALARSPQVIMRQRPEEATRSLGHLANTGAADTIQQLAKKSDAARLDWGHRNANGATKLMAGIPRFSHEVIDALLTAPSEMSAGVDNDGRNILHYAVEHGDDRLLDRILKINPKLAAYIDLPGHLRPNALGLVSDRHETTPLQCAYKRHDDKMVACLATQPIDAIDHAIDAAEAHYRGIAPAEHAPLTNVFPFDRTGAPVEGTKALDCMLGFRPTRRPVQSRLAVACEAIADRDSAVLEKILSGLSATVMRAQRERLIKEVMEAAHFPSVRVVANHYGAALFLPLLNGETALHLAAGACERPILTWLLEREGHAQALDWRDASGRTPLLSAAQRGNGACLELLVERHAAGRIDDVDADGHGLLRTLFEACPDKATDLFDRCEWASWVNRITPEDKSATLAYALRNLLERGEFRIPGVCDQDVFGAHLDIIGKLLAQPRGEIDVQQKISPTGEPVIDILGSGCLTVLVRRVMRNGRQAGGADFGKYWVDYDNAKHLSLARAHQ